jgi:hypothetical protein
MGGQVVDIAIGQLARHEGHQEIRAFTPLAGPPIFQLLLQIAARLARQSRRRAIALSAGAVTDFAGGQSLLQPTKMGELAASITGRDNYAPIGSPRQRSIVLRDLMELRRRQSLREWRHYGAPADSNSKSDEFAFEVQAVNSGQTGNPARRPPLAELSMATRARRCASLRARVGDLGAAPNAVVSTVDSCGPQP